jgi:hypothetical protein
MPMSNYLHLPVVMHYAAALEPQSVLDVGVGMGTYGFMVRQFLDIGRERVDPSMWQLRIDGIEAFPPYKNPVWDYAYDTITLADVRTAVADLPNYDLVLCNDVLEHLTRDEGRTVTRALLARSKAVIVTTPAHEYPQGAWGGNQYETHLANVTAADLPSVVVQTRCGVTALYVLSADPTTVAKIRHARWTAPTVSARETFARRGARRLARMVGL